MSAEGSISVRLASALRTPEEAPPWSLPLYWAIPTLRSAGGVAAATCVRMPEIRMVVALSWSWNWGALMLPDPSRRTIISAGANMLSHGCSIVAMQRMRDSCGMRGEEGQRWGC